MTHKKGIKRENGDTVVIDISFYEAYDEDGVCRYDVNVEFRPKGEKHWHYDNTAATPEEIHDAKLEVWELLKP